MPTTEPRRLGLLVNPIAGVGGPLAARGSDRFASLNEARAGGGLPVAQPRAARALLRLRQMAGDVHLFTAGGSMGGDVAAQSGFRSQVVAEAGEHTTSQDTKNAVRALMQYGVDTLLFAGGDGTARDIFSVVDERMTMIGIPTGVKMHSAVFALSPEAAGETAAAAIVGMSGTRRAEIMDADEAELAAGRFSARLFGYARTPDVPRLLQAVKGARPEGDEAAIAALGRVLARETPEDELVVLGAGTTMQAVKRAFGFEGTLLGVDAVLGGCVIASDADARTLEALCAIHARVRLMVGVIGNQGFIFGRGNQQISPAVIRAAGRQGLHILSTREKLLALPSPDLHADTGDRSLDAALSGYHRIRTGPRDAMMMRVIS